jgi:hypothetical protein
MCGKLNNFAHQKYRTPLGRKSAAGLMLDDNGTGASPIAHMIVLQSL